MAKVRVRPETGTLFLDFTYRGKRCREQTALEDTAENRRKVQTMLNRIVKEIAQGSFDYAATFPGSPKIARFQTVATPTTSTPATAVTAPVGPTPLFKNFAQTWRDEMAPQWRRQHRSGVEDIFNKHLVPAFGPRPVGEIAKADILAFRAELSAKPGRGKKAISPARINKVMGLLRQAMTEAADRYSLPDSFKGVKRIKARKPDVHPFSLDEVDRIQATVRADFRNYLTTRFFTGMRTGEINGLKWRYIDFDRGLILVREVFSGGEVEENAKTESSLRDIPMLPMVREALQDQFANRHPESEYVFCGRNGQPIDAHNFSNRVWYPLLRYLDIEKRRPYQTRHTTATLMLASGENPEWIAKLMGHVNTQMLFTVYSRFVPNLTRQDGRAITGLINSRSAPTNEATVPSADPTDLANLSRAQLEALVRSLAAGNDKETSHAA
jgi:integrase